MAKRGDFLGGKMTVNSMEGGESILRVSGYCCHFGRANHNGEIVTQESFGEWLEHLADNQMKLPLNYNHDPNRQIGGIDSLTPDNDGMWLEGHINTDVSFVRDELLPLIKAGDLSYLSTEGFISNIKNEGDGTYTAGTFMLTAVALVALPADFDAKPSINSNRGKEPAKRKLIF